MSNTLIGTARAGRNAALLQAGLEALRHRRSFSGFDGRTPAGPSRDEADQWFAAVLRTPFDIAGHPGAMTEQRDEVSPYTGESLGVSYPRAGADELLAASLQARGTWAETAVGERSDVCLTMLERLFEQNEVLALAAVHTTGQGRGMSRSGSGTNALDRGLEALCAAHAAVERVPTNAVWRRRFGSVETTLDLTYRTIPLGPAAVVACASFPAWNVYPAVFANLITGNPVIIKPHPSSVLQMALAVSIMRSCAAEAGFDPNLILLATDTADEPVTSHLLQHRDLRIVDFTGSATYGRWVERTVEHAAVYTETSGVNAVVVESLDDPDAPIRSLAATLVLFSGQMCVAPQNLYVPAGGIPTAEGLLSVEAFTERLVAAVQSIMEHPKRAAALMGTVQAQRTVDQLDALTEEVRQRGRVALAPRGYDHPEFPRARTCGPLIAQVSVDDHDLYGQERFGPVAFVIPVPDAAAGLAQATRDAKVEGAIAAYLLSQDEAFIADAETGFAQAGAALSINVPGPMPMGFSVAFSDYHVSGLNPAGTATLTDEAFVAGRFRVVQSRRPARATTDPSDEGARP